VRGRFRKRRASPSAWGGLTTARPGRPARRLPFQSVGGARPRLRGVPTYVIDTTRAGPGARRTTRVYVRARATRDLDDGRRAADPPALAPREAVLECTAAAIQHYSARLESGAAMFMFVDGVQYVQ
jgi:hypothetical protein